VVVVDSLRCEPRVDLADVVGILEKMCTEPVRISRRLAVSLTLAALAVQAPLLCWAQSPNVDLSRLRLEGPISFQASVSQKCPLTDAQFREYAEYVVSVNKKFYDSERLKPSQETDALANIRHDAESRRKPLSIKISYASDGARELFTKSKANIDDPIFSDPIDKMVWLNDGSRSFLISGDGRGCDHLGIGLRSKSAMASITGRQPSFEIDRQADCKF